MSTSTVKLAALSKDVATLQSIERVIHEKGRLAIVSVLAAADALTFTELRDVLGLTDGNLAAHLKPLQQAGYVKVTKKGGSGRPFTEIVLTAPGKQEFRRYINALEQIVQRHK
jgi:DNA-binding transcriptional ArsR family regulator